MIYEPREDSELLKDQIKDYATKSSRCLDMGTGSGIQAAELADYCDEVIAVDINPKAIEYCKGEYETSKIIFKESDLFSNVKEKFDLITFNPPYLPNEKKDPDIALDGGPKGWELIERFLKEAKKHLKKNGVILLLFSSFTKKQEIDKILKEQEYNYKEIANKHIHFEDLYVYEISKNE